MRDQPREFRLYSWGFDAKRQRPLTKTSDTERKSSRMRINFSNRRVVACASVIALCFVSAPIAAQAAQTKTIVTPGDTPNGASLPNLSTVGSTDTMGECANYNTFYAAADTAKIVAGTRNYYGVPCAQWGSPGPADGSAWNAGQYRKDLNKLSNKAIKFLKARTKGLSKAENKKLAVVFDIDDTLLSNYTKFDSYNFATGSAAFTWLVGPSAAVLPKIPQIVKIMKWAQKKRIKVEMITGRHNNSQTPGQEAGAPTMANLAAVGIKKPFTVHFRPPQFKADGVTPNIPMGSGPAAPYKSKIRKQIEKRKRVTLIASFGDQFSDIEGGYVERGFKIPNPMYQIP